MRNDSKVHFSQTFKMHMVGMECVWPCINMDEDEDMQKPSFEIELAPGEEHIFITSRLALKWTYS